MICNDKGGETWPPDTVFGTDPHTTMVNGIGVVGWGVAHRGEAAMLGQPVSMLILGGGLRLTGSRPEGHHGHDLVLTITEMLRKLGWWASSWSSTATGVQAPPLADRATIANMAPEYGATRGASSRSTPRR